jgi:hypothetical protein
LQIPKGHVVGKAAGVDLSVVVTVRIAATDEHAGSPERPGHAPMIPPIWPIVKPLQLAAMTAHAHKGVQTSARQDRHREKSLNLATHSRSRPFSTVCRRDMAALQHWAFYMAHRTLSVVQEGAGAWLVLPETVEARSEADSAIPCIYRLGTADAIKMARALRRQPIFELWSCVLGNPPPVPGCRHRNRNVAGKLTRLKEAHALFKGIERPLAEDDDGANVLAYVLKPKFMYAYDPDMVSVALKIPVPQDVVFVVYVRLNNPDDNSRAVIGTITHWGFVEADPNDPTLPVEHSSRYRTRLW